MLQVDQNLFMRKLMDDFADRLATAAFNSHFADNIERAVELYNLSLAVNPLSIFVWERICVSLSKLGVEHDDYKEILRFLKCVGQHNLDLAHYGKIKATVFSKENPCQPPKDFLKAIERWFDRDFIGDKEITRLYAKSYVYISTNFDKGVYDE